MKRFFALALLSLVSCASPQVENPSPQGILPCTCNPSCSSGEYCSQSSDNTCSCKKCQGPC